MKDKEFYNTFKEHARSLEGNKLKIYFDNVGVPTIGVGYTFIDKMGKKWKAKSMEVLLENGVVITQAQHKLFENYANQKTDGKVTQADINQVLAKNIKITPEVSDRLFDSAFKDKYDTIISKIKQENWDKLSDARKLAVMDHCFQRGNINTIKDHIINSDYTKAAEEMRITNVESLKARYELRASYMEEGTTTLKGIYVVKPGESFCIVAQKLGFSQKKLKELNPNIKNYNSISVGQKLNTGEKLPKDLNQHSADKFYTDHHYAYSFLNPKSDILLMSSYGRSSFGDEPYFKRNSYWQAWQARQEKAKEWSPNLLKNKKDVGDNGGSPTDNSNSPKGPPSGGSGGSWFSAFTKGFSNKFPNFFSTPKPSRVEVELPRVSLFEQYNPIWKKAQGVFKCELTN